MTKREAKQMVYGAASTILGAAGENNWIFVHQDGKPRSSEDIEKLIFAWNSLTSELFKRANGCEVT